MASDAEAMMIHALLASSAAPFTTTSGRRHCLKMMPLEDDAHVQVEFKLEQLKSCTFCQRQKFLLLCSGQQIPASDRKQLHSSILHGASKYRLRLLGRIPEQQPAESHTLLRRWRVQGTSRLLRGTIKKSHGVLMPEASRLI